MIKILSIDAVRAVEAAADAAGFSYDLMMENAGLAVARRAVFVLKQLPNPESSAVTVLVGAGKNGGDGLVAARLIAQHAPAQVRAYLLKKLPDDDKHLQAARAAGIFIADAEDDQRFRVLHNMVASANIVIDALFGVGVELPLRDEAAKLLRAANAAIHGSERENEDLEGEIIQPTRPDTVTTRPRPYVLAVDCPSGLDCDTGMVDKHTLVADETVTFIAVKPGLLTFPGAAHVGALTVATLAIPENTDALKTEPRFFVDAAYARAFVPARSDDSHKYSYGKLLVVGGSVNYSGAAGMSAKAAYRSGVGLVTVGAPAPVTTILAAHLLEATWVLLPHDMGVLSAAAAPIIREEAAKVDALLLGPGINREKPTHDLFKAFFTESAKVGVKNPIGFVVSKASDAQSPAQTMPPMVIDADGLNILSDIDDWWTMLPADTVLTPHAGEFARLAKMERDDVEKQRWSLVVEKARSWGCVVLLKGAHTLVAAPDGRTAALPFKTSSLATAGTGDILAGLIAGLIAQKVKPFEAAVLGGYVQGLAGLEAKSRIGSDHAVMAGDVLDAIPAALAALTA